MNVRDRERLFSALCKCGVCGQVITAELSANRTPVRTAPKDDHQINTHGGQFRLIKIHPTHPEARIAEFIPPNVERTLIEAEASYVAGIQSGAAALYRKAMERALKGITGESGMLNTQIQNCEKDGLIPGSMIDWLNHVRLYGNDAAHEEDFEPSKDDVDEAREFAHLFLTYTFTMPEKVKLASAKRNGEEAS